MARKSVSKMLLSMADDWVPEIREAFIEAMRGVSDTVVINNVAAAIQAGDLDRAFRLMGLNAAAMRPVTAAIERAFEAGGVAVGNTFPKRLRTPDGVGAVFRFDVRDSRAERWAREMSARMVQTEMEHIRVSIRNLASDGIRAGRNPRNIALDITGRINRQTGRREGGVIGLTKNQERWTAAVRQDLENLDRRYFTRELRAGRYDDIVQKAIETGKPLTAEQINQLTGLYNNNALRYRGEVIARTEGLNALRTSNREAHEQVISMGAVKRQNVKRIWNSTGDKRTRETHLEAERVTRASPVDFDEPFVVGDSRMMYPGDDSLDAEAKEIIQCRCIEEYEVDWAADID